MWTTTGTIVLHNLFAAVDWFVDPHLALHVKAWSLRRSSKGTTDKYGTGPVVQRKRDLRYWKRKWTHFLNSMDYIKYKAETNPRQEEQFHMQLEDFDPANYLCWRPQQTSINCEDGRGGWGRSGEVVCREERNKKKFYLCRHAWYKISWITSFCS